MVARTRDGRALRLLTLLDEYTWECLALVVGRRLTSEDGLDQLTELFLSRGLPDYIRADNGSDFTATAMVREWLARLQVQTLYLEPGSPGEKGYLESCNGKVRAELLNREVFDECVPAIVDS
jgi:transposase InsO family protein